MLPVRCFTCNKVIGHLEQQLEEWKTEHDYDCNAKDASLEPFFDKFEIERYCCRKMFLTFHDEAIVSVHSKHHMPTTVKVQDPVTYPRMYLAR